MFIHIPDTIEALKNGLGGIERLLTAKQWERAAIVYAWTEPQQGGTGRFGGNPSNQRFSLAQFASLGITGLRDKGQIRLYRKAWEEAAKTIGNDDMLKIVPGDGIDLPDHLPWKEFFGEPTTDVQDRVAISAIKARPELVAKAAQDDPAVAAAVSKEVMADPVMGRTIRRRIELEDQEALKEREFFPDPPARHDYRADLIRGSGLIYGVLRAIADDKYTLTGAEGMLLHGIASLITQTGTGSAPDEDLWNSIDEHLKGGVK